MDGWYPRNKKIIDSLISSYADDKKRHYAVFDFDDSTIIGDTHANLLVYQIENLRFAMKPENVVKNLKGDIKDEIFFRKDENGVALSEICEDIARDYAILYRKGYISPDPQNNAKRPLFANELPFLNLKAKLLEWIYAPEKFEASFFHIHMIAFLFAEMRIEDYMSLAKESFAYFQRKKSFGILHYESPKGYPNRTPPYSNYLENGLFFTKEMHDLYWDLYKAHIDIHIISASDYYDILAATLCKAYDFPPISRIWAYREIEKDGVYYPGLDPLLKHRTYQKGKKEVIEKELISQYGEAPLMITGDSVGDYEMMTSFPTSKVVLQMNNGLKDKQEEIRVKSFEQEKKNLQLNEANEPLFLVQGVNREEAKLNGSTVTQIVTKRKASF